MKINILLLLPFIINIAFSEIVIDLAGKFSNYTCFKEQGYSQTIIRSYHSYGAIDMDAQDNIRQSNAAGLATDVYMFPCRGKNATQQVNQLINYLNSMKDQSSYFTYQTGTIWLDIETNPSTGCSWSLGTFDTNCQFIKTLVTQIQAKGRAVGIYASHYMWLQILGATDKCNQFTNIPVWYAHYDQVRNFTDWETNKFGGWTTPTLKQFIGSAKVCNFNVDLSYY